MIYTTGTIAISGNTLTGTGTNFTAAGSLIRNGCTVIALTSPAQVFQITAIGSATSLTVTPAANPAIPAGTKYAILLSDSLSVDGLAQDIAETFTMYQRYMSGFADVMNGTTDVTITINGVAVTVPGQKSLAKKGANSDITSLSGLTAALSISQGGTGATNAADARTNLGLGGLSTNNEWSGVQRLTASNPIVLTRSTESELSYLSWKDALNASWMYIGKGDKNDGFNIHRYSTANGIAFRTEYNVLYSSGAIGAKGWQIQGAMFNYSESEMLSHLRNNYGGFFRNNNDTSFGKAYSAGIFSRSGDTFSYIAVPYDGKPITVSGGNDNNVSTHTLWTNRNTTVDSSGFIKSASPIVKIYSNGDFQANDESEGCAVTRIKLGEYLIEGCTGLNADAAWGGIDGGFDIPTDRNKQPLIWLDYEVNADGSILVKTYHRTHTAAPAFARNEITGLSDGEPIDIPKDQFVSVRVEMPESSIWNQRQKEAMAKETQEPAS